MENLKKRSKNFTEEEKVNLLEIIKHFMHIVENKKTDCVSVKRKLTAWTQIAFEFNAASKTGPRTGCQLKTLFDSLKKQAKKNRSNEKVQVYKTGGGSLASSQLTYVDEMVLSLLDARVEPIENLFDSNLNEKTITEESEAEDQSNKNILNTPGQHAAILQTNLIEGASVEESADAEIPVQHATQPILIGGTNVEESVQIELFKESFLDEELLDDPPIPYNRASSNVPFRTPARKRKLTNQLSPDTNNLRKSLLIKQIELLQVMIAKENIMKEREKIKLERDKLKLEKDKKN